MSETMSHAPVPEPVLAPNQFELSVPRNAQGERIGTGAMVEPLRPGMPGETVRGAILKAILRAGRTMQAPRGVEEQVVNRTGLGYVTEQERRQFEARKQLGTQKPAAEQGSGAQSPQLMEADKQQKERALDATRSALKSEVASQAESVKPQPQDRNEGVKKPSERKAQESEPETEQLYLVSRKDGHRIASFTVPKNYTMKDVTQGIQALGGDFVNYKAVYDLKTPQGWRTFFGDMLKTVKKAWQASAPSPEQPPGQKTAY